MEKMTKYELPNGGDIHVNMDNVLFTKVFEENITLYFSENHKVTVKNPK